MEHRRVEVLQPVGHGHTCVSSVNGCTHAIGRRLLVQPSRHALIELRVQTQAEHCIAASEEGRAFRLSETRREPSWQYTHQHTHARARTHTHAQHTRIPRTSTVSHMDRRRTFHSARQHRRWTATHGSSHTKWSSSRGQCTRKGLPRLARRCALCASRCAFAAMAALDMRLAAFFCCGCAVVDEAPPWALAPAPACSPPRLAAPLAPLRLEASLDGGRVAAQGAVVGGTSMSGTASRAYRRMARSCFRNSSTAASSTSRRRSSAVFGGCGPGAGARVDAPACVAPAPAAPLPALAATPADVGGVGLASLASKRRQALVAARMKHWRGARDVAMSGRKQASCGRT